MAALLKNVPVRREFSELHPKDQVTKMQKKNSIERNWQVPINEVIPASIRPRTWVSKKGAKARIGDQNVAEEVWWNWSVEFICSVEECSRMLPGRLDYARDLFKSEVERRQGNATNPQRRVIELLLGDVQRIINARSRFLRDAQTHDEVGDDDEEDDDETDDDAGGDDEGGDDEGGDDEGGDDEGSDDEGGDDEESDDEESDDEGSEDEGGDGGEAHGESGGHDGDEEHGESGAHDGGASETASIDNDTHKRGRNTGSIDEPYSNKRVCATGPRHNEMGMRSSEPSGSGQYGDQAGARVAYQNYNGMGMPSYNPSHNPSLRGNPPYAPYMHNRQLGANYGPLPNQNHQQMPFRFTNPSGEGRDSPTANMRNQQFAAGGARVAGMGNSILTAYGNPSGGASVAGLSHVPAQPSSNSLGNAPIAGLNPHAPIFPGGMHNGNYHHAPYAESMGGTQQANPLATSHRRILNPSQTAIMRVRALRQRANAARAEADIHRTNALRADAEADNLEADIDERQEAEGDDYVQ